MTAETQAERTRAVIERMLAWAGVWCGRPDHVWPMVAAEGVVCPRCVSHHEYVADEVARALAAAVVLATEQAQTTDTLTDDERDRRLAIGVLTDDEISDLIYDSGPDADHDPMIARAERIVAARQAGDRDAHQALAGDDIRALSNLIDSTYPADLSAEAHLWRRCAKVTEENGEVTEALLGHLGENPRKGQTHNLLHVRAELLDVALAALGAVAHLEADADPLHALVQHASGILARLRRALGDADDQHDGSST